MLDKNIDEVTSDELNEKNETKIEEKVVEKMDASSDLLEEKSEKENVEKVAESSNTEKESIEAKENESDKLESKTEASELVEDENKDKKNTLENNIKKENLTEIPRYDLEKLDLTELADAIENLLTNFSIKSTKNQIEDLKKEFNNKFKKFITEKKAEFIKEGGEEIDFKFDAPIKKRFNNLIFEFKKKRKEFYNNLEQEQKQNLTSKLDLIEKLKDLIDNADSSTMYKNFKSLQEEWGKIGQIPHVKYNDVWRTYHHHVERFYDLLHLNNDFRDLDFKHNLEEKTKLVEKAEELAEHKDVNHSFKELQILHRIWKEDIGPVARDLREEIWNRFSEATRKIHHKRHELQEKIDTKLHENIDVKLGIIDKIKAIDTSKIDSHKLWQESIKKLEAFREEFFTAGRVPKSKNEEIWQLFKDATKNFNKEKNLFYKSIKKDQLDNLKRKMQLVDQAETLKDSEDWELVTEVFKKIQSEWKNIGHVPRRDSDKIWKRFKDACNHYFDRLHEKLNGNDKESVEIFNRKKERLENFKEEIDKAEDFTIEKVNSFIKEWREIGALPNKLRHIDSKFNKVLDLAYKKLNIDKKEALFLKFKNIIQNYLEQNDSRKIENEQLFVRRKVDDLTKEIKQLENNISFISNATEDNPLIKNVYNNIKKNQEELDGWKKKLNYLNHLDY